MRTKIRENKSHSILSSYFNGIKEYTSNKKQKNVGKVLLLKRAYSLYHFNLKGKVMKQLRMQTRELRSKGRYSRLYSIFINWKFFTKEKGLLKKYLNECNYKTNEGRKSGSVYAP